MLVSANHTWVDNRMAPSLLAVVQSLAGNVTTGRREDNRSWLNSLNCLRNVIQQARQADDQGVARGATNRMQDAQTRISILERPSMVASRTPGVEIASHDWHFRCPTEAGPLKCHQHASNAVLRVPAVQHRNSRFACLNMNMREPINCITVGSALLLYLCQQVLVLVDRGHVGRGWCWRGGGAAREISSDVRAVRVDDEIAATTSNFEVLFIALNRA